MSELNEQAFAAWAPDESPWSVWAKPILFVESKALPAAVPGSAAAPVSTGAPDVSRLRFSLRVCFESHAWRAMRRTRSMTEAA